MRIRVNRAWSRNQFNTVIEAVPEPMLHLDAAA
jgi:hypothetical protein